MLMIILLSSNILTGCSQIIHKFSQETMISHKDKHSEITQNDTKVKIAVWSTGYTKGIGQIISKYNETNKDNITVDILEISQDKYTEIMNMLMTSGEGPDVFGLNSEMMYTYTYNDFMVDLSEYADEDFLSKFPPWAINFSRDPAYEGSFYALPSTQITFRLIYNKDLFEMAGLNPDAPPKTLAELKTYAKRITDAGKKDRKYGFALPLSDEWIGFIQSMEMPIAFSGTYYYNFKEGKYDLTVYKPWFDTISAMEREGSMFPGELSLKNDSAKAQFAEGNIGMMFASSGDPSMLYYQFPTKCDWGVALPPALNEKSYGKGAIPIYPGSCFGINAKSENLNQAIIVWKHLYSEEYLGELYKNGYELPVIKEITDNPVYKPILKNFDKFIPTSKDSPYPNTPKFLNDWSRMNAYTIYSKENNPVDNVLIEETSRLNSMIETAENAKRVDMRHYKNPGFNSKKPLEN